MITVQMPRPKPKARVFKCSTPACSGEGSHWVAEVNENGYRRGYTAESWTRAMEVAASVAGREQRGASSGAVDFLDWVAGAE